MWSGNKLTRLNSGRSPRNWTSSLAFGVQFASVTTTTCRLCFSIIGAGDRTWTCKKDLEGLHVTNYITHAFNGGRYQGRTDKALSYSTVFKTVPVASFRVDLPNLAVGEGLELSCPFRDYSLAGCRFYHSPTLLNLVLVNRIELSSSDRKSEVLTTRRHEQKIFNTLNLI